MTSSTRNEAITLASQFQEDCWNGRNPGALDDLLSDRFVRHGANGPMTRDDVRTMLEVTRAAFPDHHSKTEDIFEANGKVVCRWSSTGTHRGEFMGVPETGRVARTNGITISRIEDGKIVEQWAEWDTPYLLRSLGVSRIPINEPFPSPTAQTNK